MSKLSDDTIKMLSETRDASVLTDSADMLLTELVRVYKQLDVLKTYIKDTALIVGNEGEVNVLCVVQNWLEQLDL